ncbi:PREDICTED: cytosolic sulfotransferase 15-like [Populus euphratica]|uniref:Sulfotransferase n=1 Tax=Populus euphratica TaxID=75702 RepID=A0AAJ6U037_POPEU|nr:PREDICTED: cytosolic sulfotransferase 15-like [Populus euphratica]
MEEEDLQQLLLTLPAEKNFEGTKSLYLYKGTWVPVSLLRAVDSFQRHFIAQDTDIIVASMPKSGTTWLKALTFSVAKRHIYGPKESPLLTASPHALVPCFEVDLYMKDPQPNLDRAPPPRIFSSHSHFTNLPESIRNSKCKVVYICRNPLDQVVSYFQLVHKFKLHGTPLLSLDECFEKICRGVHVLGPFWDTVLGYWKASLERPDKVLFLKYEDLKEDIISNLKKIAEFLGIPFTEEEEKEGAIEEISRLCSFDNLRNLEVNKNGVLPSGAPNSSFFRKGKVGDWANYLSPSMAENYLKIVEEKLSGSGLTFRTSQ